MKSIWSGVECHPKTMASLVRFIEHVTESEKRMKRLAGDLVEVLATPLRKLIALRPLKEYAGRQFVYEIGEERKIVGDIDQDGVIIIRTIYGRGNPVDRNRHSVNITELIR